jgi:hypothetical protein
MKQKFVLTPDEKLTKVAKIIFGEDIVKEAYLRHDAKVTPPQYDLDGTIRDGQIVYGDDFSANYGTSIVILYINNKKVCFNSTDWGFICSLK